MAINSIKTQGNNAFPIDAKFINKIKTWSATVAQWISPTFHRLFKISASIKQDETIKRSAPTSNTTFHDHSYVAKNGNRVCPISRAYAEKLRTSVIVESNPPQAKKELDEARTAANSKPSLHTLSVLKSKLIALTRSPSHNAGVLEELVQVEAQIKERMHYGDDIYNIGLTDFSVLNVKAHEKALTQEIANPNTENFNRQIAQAQLERLSNARAKVEGTLEFVVNSQRAYAKSTNQNISDRDIVEASAEQLPALKKQLVQFKNALSTLKRNDGLQKAERNSISEQLIQLEKQIALIHHRIDEKVIHAFLLNNLRANANEMNPNISDSDIFEVSAEKLPELKKQITQFKNALTTLYSNDRIKYSEKRSIYEKFILLNKQLALIDARAKSLEIGNPKNAQTAPNLFNGFSFGVGGPEYRAKPSFVLFGK